ncbi:hypothetical protein AQJ23_44915 [Streptomyces antibioticus]|nr:hypothetical protein [Streptomyces antibioticus]KUN16539.1 hypothetical protein AQJ23_44915 [Streptomyces antibioticus]
MTYTLADAIRREFERTHPRGKNTLLCGGLCRRRKDREEFRETPWHGRRAECRDCDGMRYVDELALRDRWLLEQERERTRMYRRHIAYLRLRRILDRVPGSSADAMRAHMEPYERAVQRASERWTRALAFAVTTYKEAQCTHS